MLGDLWPVEFFENIKDDRIRSPLQKITDESLEELAYFETVLKDFGCKVIRPIIDQNDRIENYISTGTKKQPDFRCSFVPRNALQPRDDQIVAGNTLYSTFSDNPSIVKSLKEYGEVCEFIHNPDNWISENKYNEIAGADYPSYEYFIQNRHAPERFEDFIWQEISDFNLCMEGNLPTSANSFFVGQDVYIDYTQVLPYKRLHEIFPNSRINVLDAGHSHHDGCFHPIKPGAILSIKDFQVYNKTFPGWEVCYLEKDPEYMKLLRTSIKSNQGVWWIKGEEKNDSLINFIDTWLNQWVGYIEESVFDVNVLVLDEHHVCVNNMKNEKLLEFLKKHKMEPIHIPWRHRYFWDGGLHCITLDLVREGTQQDYFPKRKQPVIMKELINANGLY